MRCLDLTCGIVGPHKHGGQLYNEPDVVHRETDVGLTLYRYGLERLTCPMLDIETIVPNRRHHRIHTVVTGHLWWRKRYLWCHFCNTRWRVRT